MSLFSRLRSIFSPVKAAKGPTLGQGDTYDPHVERVDGFGRTLNVRWLSDQALEVREGTPLSICLPWHTKSPAALEPDEVLLERLEAGREDGFGEVVDESLGRATHFWREVLILHPNAKVSIAALKADHLGEIVGFLGSVAALMVVGTPRVAEEAARAVWRSDNPDVFFTTLTNGGMLMSGITGEEGAGVLPVLKETCPRERRDWLTDWIREHFGPAAAGDRRKVRKPKLVKKFTRPIAPFGTLGTYHVYEARSLADARAWLEQQVVDEDFFYLEVKTPEGDVGKDIGGIY